MNLNDFRIKIFNHCFSKVLETSNLSKMRLTNIHLKNFRCYETLDLDLDPN